MIGHFSDGMDRTFVKGTNEDQTWFLRYSDYYAAWTVDNVGPLSNAFPC
jgi:hypothetical protein